MKITVILCTYNHSQSLRKALESITLSKLPSPIEWEVLVVDNNSTDETKEIVSEFCQQYPNRFHYLFEPQQGKSYALNAGIRKAQGDILAFTDDDVTVSTTWLWNLTSYLQDEEWGGAGGRIVLEWPSRIPSWLSIKGPYARHCFPAFDQGDEPKDLVEPPFGANMAFKRHMFEKYGTYRLDLGPCSNNMVSEDTEFGRRLIQGGERLRYEPEAVVYHPVTENRINKRYFLEWYFGLGRAEVLVIGITPGTKWFIVGIPLYMFRRFAMWTLRWIVSFEPSKRFSRKVTVWQKAGAIFECRRQWIDAQRRRRRHVEA